MEYSIETIIALVTFVALLGAGMPIPLAVITPALLYLYFQGGFSAFKALGLVSWGGLNSFTLIALPLFILMAEILQQTGASSRVYAGLSRLVSFLPGGLLQTNILGCAVFSAVSGSSIATAAAIGRVALPELLSRRYDRRLSVGSLAAGGTIGILIPPSVPMIIYGTFTETSVAKLFIAGVVPGLLLTGLFMLYIFVRAKLDPSIAPDTMERPTLREVGRALVEVAPFVVLIAGTMGSLYLGWATPTEAAGVGCVLALLISVATGDFSVRAIWRALEMTVLAVSNILFIVYAAFVFSFALSFGGIGEVFTEAIVELELNTVQFILLLFAIYIVLGCLVESISMIVLTVPLLYPVMLSYGFDPLLYGVAIVMFIELGAVTPPVGLNLFVVQSIWNGKLGDVARGTLPFCGLIVLALGMIFAWPDLALWLPQQLTH